MEVGAAVERPFCYAPKALLEKIEIFFALLEVDSEFPVNFVVEVFEQLQFCVVEFLLFLFFKGCFECVECFLNFLCGSALFVNSGNAFFEVNSAFNGSEHFVACTEYSAEEFEFLIEQLVDSLVGRVGFVEEVDDDDVEFLTVAVAATNALFYALGVPGEVVVDDERAELEVDAFGCGFGGDHDGGFVAEPVNDCLAFVGAV